MKTRNTATSLTLEEGFNKFKQTKLAEMKTAAKNMKQDQMAQIQKIWKQLSQQDKSRWTYKTLNSDEKNTPQKKQPIKVRSTKMMPATISTAKKRLSSNRSNLHETEKQAKAEGMNEVSKNLFVGKSKKIKKQSKINNKTEEYRNFYKFHFNKLEEEHPNWEGDKITQIISLLWKKRKIDSKYPLEKQVDQVYQNIMNGKQAFKEFKLKSGVSEKQIDILWSRLPIESKRKWQLDSNGITLQKSSNKKGKMNLNKCDEVVAQNQFNFLKKIM